MLKMVICYKTVYILHMTWWVFVWLWCGNCERVCTKVKRECVQKLSSSAGECVAKHFLSGRENPCGNDHSWRGERVLLRMHMWGRKILRIFSKFHLSLPVYDYFDRLDKIKWHRYERHFGILPFTYFLNDTCMCGITEKRRQNHYTYLYTDLRTRMGWNEFVFDVRGLHRLIT